jgi:hypothetical protein
LALEAEAAAVARRQQAEAEAEARRQQAVANAEAQRRKRLDEEAERKRLALEAEAAAAARRQRAAAEAALRKQLAEAKAEAQRRKRLEEEAQRKRLALEAEASRQRAIKYARERAARDKAAREQARLDRARAQVVSAQPTGGGGGRGAASQENVDGYLEGAELTPYHKTAAKNCCQPSGATGGCCGPCGPCGAAVAMCVPVSAFVVANCLTCGMCRVCDSELALWIAKQKLWIWETHPTSSFWMCCATILNGHDTCALAQASTHQLAVERSPTQGDNHLIFDGLVATSHKDVLAIISVVQGGSGGSFSNGNVPQGIYGGTWEPYAPFFVANPPER